MKTDEPVNFLPLRSDAAVASLMDSLKTSLSGLEARRAAAGKSPNVAARCQVSSQWET